mmetsp:Transcript_4858/g.9620  ORF Transcript_4858/g.9620 Transcript_4858/m.9620 type:complete len:165 (-) Transcript_4858:707-1201(-)
MHFFLYCDLNSKMLDIRVLKSMKFIIITYSFFNIPIFHCVSKMKKIKTLKNSANDAPTLIESDVTIGHRAQIHSATVCSNALIGMGAVVMQSAVIESNSYVAAGAVVESGTVVKGGELWVGNPARKLRDLTEKGIERLTYQANEVSLMVQNCYYNWICYVKMIL